MKLRYILGVTLGALILAGCSEENTIGTLENITLDKTRVSIPETGGSASVTVTSAESWEVDASTIPSWLTVSPTSGSAGATTMTLSADATDNGQEAELVITVGDNTQILMVRQGSLGATTATCAEIIDGSDGKTYRAKGTCTGIYNTTYGNWYLNDGTGQITIYGTLDASGAEKNFTSLGIEVGDVIEVEGPKSTYNGVAELVNVTVISITKSLVQVLSDDAALTASGGELKVTVAYKGNGAFATVPDEAQDWIHYSSAEYIEGEATLFESSPADTAVFTFNITENTSVARAATLTFSSGSSSTTYSVTQKGAGGTVEEPYTVAQAILAAQAGATGVYVKGIVSRVSSISTSYGNATYFISDDGAAEDELEIYRGLYLGGENFTSEDQLKTGDVVIVYGDLTEYKDQAEMAKDNYIYSLNGDTGGTGEDSGGSAGTGSGTADDPYNVAAVTAYTISLGADVTSDNQVYASGIISSIKYTYSAKYGTATYNISDDGTETDEYTVYGSYYFDNAAWVEGNTQIAVGDKVTVCGNVIYYKGTTPEFASKKNYLVELNGATQ